MIVLIIAEEIDVHALVVAKRIESLGGQAYILDSADFLTKWTLTQRIENGEADTSRTHSTLQITQNDETVEIERENISGIWWRRPRTPTPASEVSDSNHRKFIKSEARHALEGWLHGLGDRMLNRVAADEAAHRKPFQLQMAAEIGLRIPKTVITNSPIEVLSFVNQHDGPVVFKPLNAPYWQAVETRRLDSIALDHLEKIQYSPVILQEEIRKKADVRVTVVDGTAFAATIIPEHPGAQLDWRLDKTAEITLHELPEEITSMLVELLDRLGLRMGVFDLALTDDGEYVFFEVNTQGQWLFVEIPLGQKISWGIAHALLNPPKSEPENISNEVVGGQPDTSDGANLTAMG